MRPASARPPCAGPTAHVSPASCDRPANRDARNRVCLSVKKGKEFTSAHERPGACLPAAAKRSRSPQPAHLTRPVRRASAAWPFLEATLCIDWEAICQQTCRRWHDQRSSCSTSTFVFTSRGLPWPALHSRAHFRYSPTALQLAVVPAQPGGPVWRPGRPVGPRSHALTVKNAGRFTGPVPGARRRTPEVLHTMLSGSGGVTAGETAAGCWAGHPMP